MPQPEHHALIFRVEYHRDPPGLRQRVLQKLQSLLIRLRSKERQACGVATGCARLSTSPAPTGSAETAMTMGSCLSPLGGLRRRRVHCDNDIHVEADKFDSKCKETLRLTLCVSVLDANVPSLDPSEVRKTLSKGVDLSRDGGVGFAREKAYSAVFPIAAARAPRVAWLPRRRRA